MRIQIINVALQVLEFEFKSAATQEIAKEWSHLGVTGSGDLEVLMEKKALNGGVKAKVVTPVKGFDAVWEKMLGKFVTDTGVGPLLTDSMSFCPCLTVLPAVGFWAMTMPSAWAE